MRRPLLANGRAIACVAALALYAPEQALGQTPAQDSPSVFRALVHDPQAPERPPLAPQNAPRPIPRTDALLSAILDGAGSRKGVKEHDLLKLASGPGADPVAGDLLEWKALQEGAGGWTEVEAFLRLKPGWPGERKLRRRAEILMPEGFTPEERKAFFGERPPLTARGARMLGEALIALGERERGEAEIVRAWREKDMGGGEETVFVARHGKLLEPHHTARFEMLVFRRKFSAARRLAKLLPSDYAKLAAAVSALVQRRKGVDQLIAQVPEALRDHPALAYARMVWRDKRKRRDEAEQAVVDASKGELGSADAWADRRVLFVREAWQEGRYADAVALAEGHGLSSGADFAELEWMAGWIALTKLDDPQKALKHFETLYHGTVTPISRGRGAYWAGRAAQAAGDKSAAERWFRRAASYPTSFYGQLGIGEIDVETLLFAHADPKMFRAAAGLERNGWSAEERKMAGVAVRLYRGGDRARGREFARALASRTKDAAAFMQLAAMARRYGDPSGEIQIAKLAYDADIMLWASLYPVPNHPQFLGRKVEPALLLAIARQESRFKVGAESHAGARGLMQLMPATARSVARRVGVPYDQEALFAQPAYNLQLADAFLYDLIEMYDGSYVLAIAAYNGGPGNVQKWLKRFGDPRDPNVDVIDWIESIPFKETRSYVMRVMEGMQVYRVRLAGGRGYIRMGDDLVRGERK